jgi:hypothetical protein
MESDLFLLFYCLASILLVNYNRTKVSCKIYKICNKYFIKYKKKYIKQ